MTAFANNYNKSDKWVDDTLKLWARGLNSINDKDLVRGTETWCRTKRTLPNLARLLELIAADPTTSPAAVFHGCPACDGTGWREMVRHYNDNGRALVRCCVAACDCQKGARLATGVVDNWRTVLEAWENDPRTDRVFYSTTDHPHLTTEQRHTAEQLQGMAERAKQATNGTTGGWKRPVKAPQ